MIKVENLCKSYDGKTTVLEGLNCNIEKGTIYGLVGLNGAGKTTLLKILSGIYTVDSGSATIEDQTIYENEDIKQRTVFVPDELYFLPHATMNTMAKFYQGYYPNFDMELFNKLIEIFDLNTTKKINKFSKGMQRQAAILLAISCCPDYLLLDESFDGIDPTKRKLVKQMLIEVMAEREMTIVVSSHNIRELDDLCDHIGSIKDKKIVFDCSLEEARATKVKCRVAFKDEKDEAVLDELHTENLSKSGRMISFITAMSEEELNSKISPLEPLLFEILPMTLEEILISQAEVKNYDFKELFKN